MTYEQIEAFLAVVECGTFTNASERLYVTQSALSHRINELEKELGERLIVRKKGLRSVELTPQGLRFVPRANQWNQLWLDTFDTLRQKNSSKLCIAAPNSLEEELFPHLYRALMKQLPNLRLKMTTTHYSEAYRRIESGEIDFAILAYPLRSEHVKTIPVGKEALVFVCGLDSDYADHIPVETLNPKQELRLGYGQNYVFWHDHYLGAHTDSRLETNNLRLAARLLNDPGVWSIFPQASAEALQERGQLRICQITPPPPFRFLYLTYNSHSVPPLRDTVLETVRDVMSETPYFHPEWAD